VFEFSVEMSAVPWKESHNASGNVPASIKTSLGQSVKNKLKNWSPLKLNISRGALVAVLG